MSPDYSSCFEVENPDSRQTYMKVGCDLVRITALREVIKIAMALWAYNVLKISPFKTLQDSITYQRNHLAHIYLIALSANMWQRLE